MVKNFLALVLIMVLAGFAMANGEYTGGGGGGPALQYISIPDTMAVAVDREMNIWYSQLGFQTPGTNYFSPFAWSELGGVPSTDAGPLKRCYRYKPTASSTGDSLVFKVFDPGHKQVAASSVVVTSVENDGGGSGAYNVLFIGDSLVAGGEIVSVVDSLFTADGGPTATMVGSVTSSSVDHEGHIGWEFETFTASGSPFYIGGKLDFQQYCTDNSIADIDYVVINLGLNDSNLDVLPYRAMNSAGVDSFVIDYAKTLVDAILDPTDGYPDCKIIIGIESTGAADQAPQYFIDDETGWSYRYYSQATMQKITASLLATFDGYAYSENVDVCHAGLWVDKVYGYPISQVAVSGRSPNTELMNTNFIHPSYVGYQQMADAYYSHLRWWMIKDTPAGTNELADSWDIRDASGCWVVPSTDFYVSADTTGITGSSAVAVYSHTDRTGVAIDQQTAFVPSGDEVVLSVRVKNNGHTGDFYLNFFNVTDTENWRISFDFSGVGGAPVINYDATVGNSDYEDLGDDWYRVWLYLDLVAESLTTQSFAVRLSPFATGAVAGAGVIIDGVQLEYDVTTPGNYIKTDCP